MKWFESLIRRVFFSFSIATYATFSYLNMHRSIPVITIVISIILFLLSWKIEKEVKSLIINYSIEEDQSLWGEFESKYPKLAALAWQFILTFAAIHMVYIALDLLKVIEVNGMRFELATLAFVIAVIFRLIDRNTYKKM